MYNGSVIDELIESVTRAEQHMLEHNLTAGTVLERPASYVLEMPLPQDRPFQPHEIGVA